MKWIRKALILGHRYLGIALSLLFVLWFASGIGMVFAGGMPRLDPATRLDRMPALDLSSVRLTPLDAAMRAGLVGNSERAALLTVLNRPVYRFGGGGATVFADTGEPLPDVGEAESMAIAATFMHLPASTLHHVARLERADQWTIGQRRELPLHKITVDDAAGTQLYVSEETAEVVMHTTRRARALAWVAAIPHWLYFQSLRVNDALWTRVILWTSGLGTVFVLMGLVLGAVQYRVKYAGWMRWHYWTGVVFGVFALTWVASGYLSMETIDWFSEGSDGGAGIPQALSGGPFDLAAFPALDAAAWTRVLGGKAVKEIEFRRIQDEPYYELGGLEAKPVLMSARTMRVRRVPFSLESVIERVQKGYYARVLDSRMLFVYDAYYYDRHHDAPLPVVRVQFGDADKTWIYVDGTSQMVARFTSHQRVERWLYHGLHSLDFPFWYYSRWWEVGVIALLLGGTTLSVIGVVIGFKRVRRWVVRFG